MDGPQGMIDRLVRATNDHDVNGVAACFAEDYRNETPAHPARSFRGREQVRRNWDQIFAFVPDWHVEVGRCAIDGDSAWTEWEMSGTRRDGTDHQMRGVVIFGVSDGVAEWARFYLEPVDLGCSMELFRAKYAAEEHLRASGVRWTIVRAGAFVELWAEIMAKPIVFGRGENPINFVSARDVAAVVERAILDPDMRQKMIEVGGPQNISFNELAVLLQQVRSQPAKIRHVPTWLLRTTAPFARRARAALTMDTTDMTFDAIAARRSFADLPMTDLQTALTHSIS